MDLRDNGTRRRAALLSLTTLPLLLPPPPPPPLLLLLLAADDGLLLLFEGGRGGADFNPAPASVCRRGLTGIVVIVDSDADGERQQVFLARLTQIR
jgi:hypothetical protein